MEPKEYFGALSTATNAVLNSSLNDAEVLAVIGKALTAAADLDKWVKAIERSGRDSIVLAWALREYQFSIFLAATGHYRNAFAQLRLFMELAFACIHFSNDEIARRKWLAGGEDIRWSVLNDDKDGLLSKKIATVFLDSAQDNVGLYRALAGTVYRECSEYVHGNAETHVKLEGDLKFNKELVLQWAERSESACISVLMAMTIRYLKDFADRSKESIELVRDGLQSKLGHVPAVASILS